MAEIKFRRDTKLRKLLFDPHAFQHPAKMDAQLLIWIVEHFTKPGETILDPMFGSGTTMLACLFGRNVVGIETVQRFVDLATNNWKEVSMKPQLGIQMGTCQIKMGDSRHLDSIFADKAIFSPPYGIQEMGGGLNTKPPREGSDDQSGRSAVSPSQLGAGKYDKIVTSPPYGDPIGITGGNTQTFQDKYGYTGDENIGYSKDKTNIGNLPYGDIDKIISSPPYAGSEQFNNLEWIDKNRNRPGNPEQLQGDIGQLPYGDIDKMASGSYLGAMFAVYLQCHKVLKSDGLMVLVTKNFIREKKIVRLDLDTIKLCEKAGFYFMERHYRKLMYQSFWRIQYHNKYPGVPLIDAEDVLVFSKIKPAPEDF